MQKLLLLDGNSMLFRAYYATLYGSSIDGVPSAMSTSNGIPTNAIFGFVMMLNKVIDLIQPDALLVAWDADSQTFRKEEYPAYKGTRKPLDEELIVQFPIVREFLDAAGIADMKFMAMKPMILLEPCQNFLLKKFKPRF